MNMRIAAKEVFKAGIEGVMPSALVMKYLYVDEKGIKAGDKFFPFDTIKNIYVVGAGKAGAKMASAAESILGNHLTGGHVVVKYGFAGKPGRIEVSEAGHPVPDTNSFISAGKILDIVKKAGKNDLVICLISGGGSSLMADLPEGISEENMRILNAELVNSGATIGEINTVRKHLSSIKGGQLARAANPAKLISLIISDVPGDKTDVIASGPTVPDPTTFYDAMEVINRYGLADTIPEEIMKYLDEGLEGCLPETPKPGDPLFEEVTNIIIGNNGMALKAAAAKAGELNMNTVIEGEQLQGDVYAAAERIISASLSCKADMNVKKPVCLIFGGETTLRVTGSGLGGRNQHLALQCLLKLGNTRGITILSAGTDGNDGPTDAAGAVVDSRTYSEAYDMDLDIQGFADSFDSWNFFNKAGGHIKTGPTMTNVMDIVVVIIE